MFDLTPNSQTKIVKDVWQTVIRINTEIIRVKAGE